MKKYIRIVTTLIFLAVSFHLFGADDQKVAQAHRTDAAITIDGVLDESAWSVGQPASEFIELEPYPGIAASEDTDVYILYDDAAVYIGANMHSNDPENIPTELSLRDEFGNADWFGFVIDAYQDGINGLGFFITSSGVQADAKYSTQGEDFAWNSVWSSAVNIHSTGWSVELRIPYSAIRFPKTPTQVWNVNFLRLVRLTRQKSFWSPLDPEVNGFINQFGRMEGIKDIKPPVRLSATPFAVNTIKHSTERAGKKWQNDFSGGVDIKYGINDAFTLDMTLIPDFSQVRSDDQVLNLSPFEVRFDENRQFFTEGTELFNKGGLFYSRRIGGRPFGTDNLDESLFQNEIIDESPSRARLLNATKVSGRTKNGLGLGFFNGITGNSWATIRDTITDESREVLVDPVTNYNVLVFDQSLRNNSYVTLINTNVLRSGSFMDANVTGAQFELNTNGNNYGVRGGLAYSQQFENDITSDGFRWNLNVGKRSGTFIYSARAWIVSDTYDHNDLGFLRSGNEANYNLDFSYRIFEPKGMFQRINFGFEVDYESLYKPSRFSDLDFELSAFGLTKKNEGMRAQIRGSFVESRDYFEPRTDDFSRYYRWPKNILLDGLYSSNYNKKLAFDFRASYRFFDQPKRSNAFLRVKSRYRFSDKFTLGVEVESNNRLLDEGYVSAESTAVGYQSLSDEDILFGVRDRKTLESNVEFKYIFHENMGLTFRARHYWSRVEYQDYGLLDHEGRLTETEYAGIDEKNEKLHDNNFNAFNIDLIYTWRYAPGSDIIFVWKNQILQDGDELILNYWDNISDLSGAPQVNTFSLKVIYFLDYLYLKR